MFDRNKEKEIAMKTVENNVTGILHNLRRVLGDSDYSWADFQAEMDRLQLIEEKDYEQERAAEVRRYSAVGVKGCV